MAGSSVNKIVCQYRSAAAAKYQIMTLDTANNYQKTILTTSDSDKTAPSFSWDGTKIVFRNDSLIVPFVTIRYISGTNYSVETTTGQAGSFPCFNPAETKIVYSLITWPNGDVYQMNLDGTSITNLTLDSAKRNDHPSFNYAGTKIAYMELLTGIIYTMNADGTGKMAITNPPSGKTDYDPSLSQDGSWIVFNRYTNATNQTIYVVKSTVAEGATNVAIPLTTVTGCENGYPVFNPDGTKVVFASDRGGLRDLYTVNFSGTGTLPESGLTNITNATGTEDFYEPDWK